MESKWIKNYRTSYKRISNYMNKLEYSYEEDVAKITMCQVYDSVYLWANDVYLKKIPCEQIEDYHYLKINICLEGNCEVQVLDGRYVYLETGMVNVDLNQSSGYYQYPSKRYRGIEIVIDLAKVGKQSVLLLKELDLSADYFVNMAEKKTGSYIGKANAEFVEVMEHIYSKLMQAKESVFEYRYDLVRVLYGLKNGNVTEYEKNFYLSKGQREIAQAAEEILTKDLSIRYSMETLAEQFKISPSSLKKYFEICYGSPVSEYMRTVRIEEGKRRLADTKESVIEIASKVGYASQGKFCAMFKKAIGMTPLEYRRIQAGGRK